MANRKILLKRRKTARNIRKITRTMQLIATARFQQAFNRAVNTKPYVEKLAELVSDLSQSAEGLQHPLFASPDVNRTALVVLTSMRGLCGGYNANVLRAATHHLDAERKRGVETDVLMFGKKGVGVFRFLKRPMVQAVPKFPDMPRFEHVEPIADGLMDRFLHGELASVHVAYMRFLSASQQRPRVVQLLPLAREAGAGDKPPAAGRQVEYEFSPAPKELLDELLPATVRVRLFQCFTDAAVSEQVARMVAMKAATDAAGEMIRSLTRRYNRARQTYITMELLDIVGGANALE
jgi:F-type H+-transporting ATPase subunit gamma